MEDEPSKFRGKKDFDTILEDYVGGGGKWQWMTLLWLSPIHVACTIPLLLHLFSAYTPGHRCFVENCDNLESSESLTFNAQFLNFTTPNDHASNTFLR
jgi:hypothetical protein